MPSSEQHWKYYIIPDLKTWAESDPAHPKTPIEYYEHLEDALDRFLSLRYQPYNMESTQNESTGLPYSRLTFGIGHVTAPSAVDLIHVQHGHNILLLDFVKVERTKNDSSVMDILSTFHAKLGIQDVLVHRKMTAEEIKDFTRANMEHRLQKSEDLSSSDISYYLQQFDQKYETGAFDSLKPSLRQQEITELQSFHIWENPFFHAVDTPENLAADLAAFSFDYDVDSMPDLTEGSLVRSDVLQALQSGETTFLHDWLTSIVKEESSFSSTAKQLLLRLAGSIPQLQKDTIPDAPTTLEPMKKPELTPNCPVYLKTIREARSCGELDQWRQSHDANCACAQQFAKEYSLAYHEHNAPDFIQSMIDRYGMDRCKIIIASNIQLAPHDGRYHSHVKEIAAGIQVPEANPDYMHDRRMDYITNCHPVMLNIAMQILEEKEQALTNKKTKQPRTSILARLKNNQKAIATHDQNTKNPEQQKPVR